MIIIIVHAYLDLKQQLKFCILIIVINFIIIIIKILLSFPKYFNIYYKYIIIFF